jgi:hypothetical protein
MALFKSLLRVGKIPTLAVAAMALGSISAAHALTPAQEEAMKPHHTTGFKAAMNKTYNQTQSAFDRASVVVGAGANSYIAQTSPSTGFAMDARLDAPFNTTMSAEASAATAFGKSADGDGQTIPMLLDAGLKYKVLRTAKSDLYGAGGVGYGAYFGTKRLEDGATFGVPLSVGADWAREKVILSPRFTYRPVFGDQLGPDDADADSWTAVLDLKLPFL